MSITHKHITLYIDLLACIVFIPLTIMVLPMEKWLMHSVPCVQVLIAYVYVLYFVYRRVHLPQMVIRRHYLAAAAVVAVLLLVTVGITHITFGMDFEGLTQRQIDNRQAYRRQTFWFFFLIVSGFSLSIELAFELFRQMMSKQEIEARKDKAELMLYKSQINPHFLFNTLNTLYALVISQSDKTESAFIKFSNILRYSYSQVGADMTPIGSEMEYISQYVDLQKLRLNHHTRVEMVTDIDDDTVMIPPMILITFIENAFKYGTSSEKDCLIRISTTLKDGLLRFETENGIMRTGKKSGGSVGLENCCKRLNLVYGDRYTLVTDDKDGIYRSTLTIHLK